MSPKQPGDVSEVSRRAALGAPAAMLLVARAGACAAQERRTTAEGSRSLVA
jgi:hypothetical protein